MLIGHKAELGIKHISRVTLVTNRVESKSNFIDHRMKHMHLFFEIEDVPSDRITGNDVKEEKPAGEEIVELDIMARQEPKGFIDSRILRILNEGRIC